MSSDQTPGDPPPLVAGTSRRARAAAYVWSLVLFVALALAHTWPLVTAPGTLSRNDNGDTMLHEWIMAWVVHQSVADPAHLFDANIFYPEPKTLAYSDPLIVESVFAAPLIWSGASPVVAYNAVMVLGYVLTGWVTCLVLRLWTGSWLAGILAGCLATFNSFTLTSLPQIQLLHLEFFPLMLVALDRLLTVPRARYGVQLAGWYVLEALTGNYLLVFTAIAIVAALAARADEWLGRRFRAVAPGLAIAAAISVAALTPVLLPYLSVSRSAGLVRSLEETAIYSASATDYIAAAGNWHFEHWSRPFFHGSALFPGVTALLLAGVALASGIAWRDRRARMALVFGVVTVALSFGPAFAPYRWLYKVFPLLAGIRGAVRFAEIALVAIAMLAAFGLSAVMRRVGPRWAVAVGIVTITVANFEALRAPFPYEPYQGIPAIYDKLAKAGNRAVVVSFPFYNSSQFHLNADFMLASTRFWKPMLNGYSGFKPPSFYRAVDALANFPDPASIQYLRDLGVTHVVVDGRMMPRDRLPHVSEYQELQPWVSDGTLTIYLLVGKS
jgi:hypothetical protein